jgi:hypothetical protein
MEEVKCPLAQCRGKKVPRKKGVRFIFPTSAKKVSGTISDKELATRMSELKA